MGNMTILIGTKHGMKLQMQPIGGLIDHVAIGSGSDTGHVHPIHWFGLVDFNKQVACKLLAVFAGQ